MILCIDDEPIGLFIRKFLLESLGYSVLTATSGREGLDLFATQPVRAVLLDYTMPEMNGGEVAAEMKRRNPKVPILLLSSCLNIPQEILDQVEGRVFKGDPPATLIAQIKQLLEKTDSAATA